MAEVSESLHPGYSAVSTGLCRVKAEGDFGGMFESAAKARLISELLAVYLRLRHIAWELLVQRWSI